MTSLVYSLQSLFCVCSYDFVSAVISSHLQSVISIVSHAHGFLSAFGEHLKLFDNVYSKNLGWVRLDFLRRLYYIESW